MSDYRTFRESQRPARTFTCCDCGAVRGCATRGPALIRCRPCALQSLTPRRHINQHADTTCGTAVVDALTMHGSMTTGELRAALSAYRPHTLRTTCARLAQLGMVTRAPMFEGSKSTTRWTIGSVEYVERAAHEIVPEEPERDWVPRAWVNPIKAGTATKLDADRMTALPMDYSDPRRRAA